MSATSCESMAVSVSSMQTVHSGHLTPTMASAQSTQPGVQITTRVRAPPVQAVNSRAVQFNADSSEPMSSAPSLYSTPSPQNIATVRSPSVPSTQPSVPSMETLSEAGSSQGTVVPSPTVPLVRSSVPLIEVSKVIPASWLSSTAPRAETITPTVRVLPPREQISPLSEGPSSQGAPISKTTIVSIPVRCETISSEAGSPTSVQSTRTTGTTFNKPPVAYPDPPFDDMLVASALRNHPELREVVGDPALCAITVRDLEILLQTIQEDMFAYCEDHWIDDQFRHVCKNPQCPYDHKAAVYVQGNYMAEEEEESDEQLLPDVPANLHLVVARYIKPWTLKHRVSYAGALLAHNVARIDRDDDVDEELIKGLRASAFISHNWDELYPDFVTTALSAMDRDTATWVCAFLINQNGDISETLGTDLSQVPFARALRHSDRVIVFMDHKAATLTRSWVVFEAYQAVIAEGKMFHCSLPNNSDRQSWAAVREKLEHLDVRTCQASRLEDHALIMSFISGREDELNQAVIDVINRQASCAEALDAARAANFELLSKHPEPLAEDAGFTTTLHYTATVDAAESCQLMTYLIEQKADVGRKNKDGDTPLHFAARFGRPSTIMVLQRHGADLLAKNNDGATPLHLAAQHGHEVACATLLQGKVPGTWPEAVKDRDGCVALHLAAANGHGNLTASMIHMGANPDEQNDRGRTPLHEAANAGKTDAAGWLISSGAKIDCIDTEGETPLHTAASAGHVDMVEKLIQLGAAVDAAANNGWTPLHLASCENRCGIISTLARLRASVGAVDTYGWTALHVAAAHDHADAVEKLVELGVARDAKSDRGRTALHIAAETGSMRVVSRLQELEVDADCTDNDGNTPLHVAAAKGHTDVAIALVDLGCRLDATNCKGRTPSQEAAHHDQDTVAVTLDELGLLNNNEVQAVLSHISQLQRGATGKTQMTVMQARLYKARRRVKGVLPHEKKCKQM